jgi:anti-sigma-K factor RskA
MTTLDPATRLSSPELAVTRAGPPLRVQLPAGGWQVGFRAQHDGRTVIEVTGQDGSLAGLVASSRLPILSVDAGWGGAAREPSVTFTRRLPGARRTAARPDAVDGLWGTVDGLWAAAAGRYTAVCCAAGPVTLTRRLRPVTARLAPW